VATLQQLARREARKAARRRKCEESTGHRYEETVGTVMPDGIEYKMMACSLCGARKLVGERPSEGKEAR
jgi:hypothetical protein